MLLPANASEATVQFRLVNSKVARAVNLAVQLSLDGGSLVIDSINTDKDWSSTWANQAPSGEPGGTFVAGFLEPSGAQPGPSSDLLDVYISTTPSSQARPIIAMYVELPPVVNNDSGQAIRVNRTIILDAGNVGWIPDSTACRVWNTGDVNGDLSRTAADIIGIVNYVFKSGPAPYPCPAVADVNCSAAVSSADIISMVNHIFKAGPVPCDVCALIPSSWSCAP